MRPFESRVHRAEPGRCKFSRLAAGKERNAWDCGRNSAQQTLYGSIGNLFIRVLVRTLQSGHDHVRFQNHALKRDALSDELSKDCMLGSFGDRGAALHGVVPIHQHFGLDNRNQARLLAQRGIESEDERHSPQDRRQLGMLSPIVITARHLANRAPIFT